MKNLIQNCLLLAFIFVGVAAQADNQGLPDNSILVATLLPRTGYTEADAVNDESAVSTGDLRMSEYATSHAVDLSIGCQQVIYVWNLHNNSYYGGTVGVSSMSIGVYCVPRSPGQKFVMSVEQSCEKNPTMDCVKLIPQFDQIAPTTSRQINRPK